ncbi:hypothetical protein [Streptomyces purpurascens]|uniref:hypothetical protein n=1 Tax=Streptomyces purpurascens TaxID=1924 RepID=UPI003F4D5FEA
MEQCATATPSTEQPDTELAVGDTFAYTDGLKVKVDSIRQITRFGEYDSRPDAGQIPFRVTFTVTNGTDKPYDLDDLGATAEGGTTGGETRFLYVTVGSAEKDGRLAPGRAGTFTEEYSIDKNDASSIVFSMSRSDEAWLVAGRPFPRRPVPRPHQRPYRRRRPAPEPVHTEGRPARGPCLVRHAHRRLRGRARLRRRADRGARTHPDRPLPGLLVQAAP